MSTILSAPFENTLTGGLAWDSLTNGSEISQDLTQFRHGATSMKVTGNAAHSIFGSKTITTSTVAGSFYFRFPTLPGTATLIVRGLHPTRTPGISINPNGKLQSHIGATDAPASPSTVLAVNTWYLIDYKFDTSTSTFTVDFKISDLDGNLLSTAAQLTATGQTAANMTALIQGQCASLALTAYFDDCEATNSLADYPIGVHTSDDGTFDPITTFPASWIDDPSLIDGCLFGMMTQNVGVGDNGQAALAEGATKANRRIYIFGTYYDFDITAIPTLSFEKSIQNGSLLGHQAWPMLHFFGFGSLTVHWPSGGLADFTSGAMDTTIDALCTKMNTQLGATPFLIRPFREMNNNAVIYGRAGASNGGLNETPTAFIAAWRHVITRIRSQCPMARFIWCPDTTTTPSDIFTWYPGSAWVDWIAADGYVTAGNSYQNIGTHMQPWYQAFATDVGTLVNDKPVAIAETSVQAADPNRIADFEAFTAAFTAMPKVKFINVWDSAPAGPYYVSDSPAGFLAAFQNVVGNPPFTGSAVPYHVTGLADSDGTRIAAADDDGERTFIPALVGEVDA